MGGEFELTQPLPLKEGRGARLQDGVASIMEIKKGINCLNVAPPPSEGDWGGMEAIDSLFRCGHNGGSSAERLREGNLFLLQKRIHLLLNFKQRKKEEI